jgi:hypothetical protein
MNNIFYVVIIFLIIIILINVLPKDSDNYYANEENNEGVEGFSIPGLGDMNNTINNITSIANSIPKEINNIKSEIGNSVNSVEKIGSNITGQIDDKLTNFVDEVENLVTKKIKKFFTQFGDMLNNGIVKPVIGLFEGIGNIFLAIFDLLKQIADKIMSLPSCILIYMGNSFFNSIYYIYALIIPKFIRAPIDYIFKIIIQTPISYICDLLGITSSINKCYSFNVEDSIDKMNKQISKINTSFKKEFGHLDFNSITF